MANGYEAQMALLVPVQRKSKGPKAGDVHEAAAQGIAGGGASLPHGGQIQHSFGGYDISNVTAHTDSAAARANAAMGADAYATGSHIAFVGAPDLHTAAHEAAHVVQQKAGVQLSGGVGQAGDAYEVHADKVADAVVAGQDASPILSQAVGRGSEAGIQRQVQRLETSTSTTTNTTENTERPENTREAEVRVDAPPKVQLHGYGGVRHVFGKKVKQMEQELTLLEAKEASFAAQATPAAVPTATTTTDSDKAATTTPEPTGMLTLEDREKKTHLRTTIDDINRTKGGDYLIFAGHIGVSLDGGSTIYGFTPVAPEGMPGEIVKAHLHNHTMTFPGALKDDKTHFELAEECATNRGWDTETTVVERDIDTTAAATMLQRLQELAGMQPGAHGVYYSFPLVDEEDGKWFKDTPGPDGKIIRGEAQANCATFPAHIGVELPEKSGNLRYYMPAMREEAKSNPVV